MSTAGDIVDRVIREWIYPGDDQPTQMSTTDGLTNAADTIFSLETSGQDPADVDNIAVGTVLEVPSGERLLISAIGALVGTAQAVTVVRGYQDTGGLSATVAAGAVVTVAPTYSRKAIFDAVCDEVVGLYPRLWWTRTRALTTATSGYTDGFSDLATPVSFQYTSNGHARTTGVALIPNFTGAPSGAALYVDGPGATAGYLTYRAKFTRPADETTDLVAAGVISSWDRILVLGAAAYILGGGIASSHPMEFLSEPSIAETHPPSTPIELATRILQLQEHYIEKAARSLAATEEPLTAEMATVWRP